MLVLRFASSKDVVNKWWPERGYSDTACSECVRQRSAAPISQLTQLASLFELASPHSSTAIPF